MTTMPQMDNAIGTDPDKPQPDGTAKNSHNLDKRIFQYCSPGVCPVPRVYPVLYVVQGGARVRTCFVEIGK